MHLDELHELCPVVLGQPVGRLDLPAGLHVFEKALLVHWNLDRCHLAPLPNDR